MSASSSSNVFSFVLAGFAVAGAQGMYQELEPCQALDLPAIVAACAHEIGFNTKGSTSASKLSPHIRSSIPLSQKGSFFAQKDSLSFSERAYDIEADNRGRCLRFFIVARPLPLQAS